MGMNVTASAVPTKQLWIDYDRNKYNWWADYKLLELLELQGTVLSKEEKSKVILPKNDDSYDHIYYVGDITFNQQQINNLILICDQIINGTYNAGKSKNEYEKKYSNETPEEFVMRWTHIKNNLMTFHRELNWEESHVVIYTSY